MFNKCQILGFTYRQLSWYHNIAKNKTWTPVPFPARLAHGYPQGWFSKFIHFTNNFLLTFRFRALSLLKCFVQWPSVFCFARWTSTFGEWLAKFHYTSIYLTNVSLQFSLHSLLFKNKPCPSLHICQNDKNLMKKCNL